MINKMKVVNAVIKFINHEDLLSIYNCRRWLVLFDVFCLNINIYNKICSQWHQPEWKSNVSLKSIVSLHIQLDIDAGLDK